MVEELSDFSGELSDACGGRFVIGLASR